MSRGNRAQRGFVFNLVIALAILIGVGLLIYPTVADYYNRYHSTRLIAGYADAVSRMSEADFDAMFAEADAYNQALYSNPARFQPDEAELDKYNAILDITGTGIMGYIEIPDIKVRLPVYHTVSETVLQIAAGHIPGSSFPIGNGGTHAAISGHSALPSAKLFTDLESLEIGNSFELHVLNNIYRYEIDAINIVLPDEMDLLALDSSQDYITLITCTPYGVNSHRLLVRGVLVDTRPESSESDNTGNSGESNQSNNNQNDLRLWFVVIVVLLGILLLCVLFCGVNGNRNTPDEKQE